MYIRVFLVVATIFAVLAFRYFTNENVPPVAPRSSHATVSDAHVEAGPTSPVVAELSSSASELPSSVSNLIEPPEIPDGCEVDYDENGNERDMLKCEPLVHEFHDYWSYPPASLRDMAHGDAKAAEILGMRLMSVKIPEATQLGLEYILRAAALSGESGAIDGAIGTFFSLVADESGPRIDNIKRGYVLISVANTLGGRDMNWYERLLHENHVTSEEISMLDAAAEQTLRELAALQYDVTGEQSIGKLIGATD